MSATPDHPESEPVPAAKDSPGGHVAHEVHDTSRRAAPHAAAADLHVAPSEPHPIKLNFWQRWMAWSGSFFVLSLLVHVILIGGATLLVVQVVAGRKEKLKFTAPPPSAAGPKTVEHKVKMSKATASAPSVSKRITSTAANASIALPAMEMSSSSAPDVMASVMSGLGTGSLGVGAAAGGSAMPSGGLTAFGFRGGKGLVGTFYDLKQTSDKTKIKGDLFQEEYAAVIGFIKGGWDPKLLQKYFSPSIKLKTGRIYIPFLSPKEVLPAFDLQGTVEPSHWIIHYSGKFKVPRGGEFRFRGRGDNWLCVRIKPAGMAAKNVFTDLLQVPGVKELFPGCEMYPPGQPPGILDVIATDDKTKAWQKDARGEGTSTGPWFTLNSGEVVEIDILIGESPGTNCEFCLLIEEKDHTYNPPGSYPVFEVTPGLPPVKVERRGPPVAKERLVFPVQD